MPTYKVRLESATDSQARTVTVADAKDEGAAVALATEREHELLAYEMDGKRHDTLAKKAIILPDGKIKGLKGRDKADFMAHNLVRPYEAVDAKLWTPSTMDFVQAAKAMQQDPVAWKKTLDEMRKAGIPMNVLASMYGLAWLGQIAGSSTQIVWSSATVKVSLHTSTYTPNIDTHDFFNDATNEITGTGYTAGGATLGSKSSTYDTASDQIRLDGGDTSWTTSTLTARYAVIWIDTAGASTTDPVLGYVDFQSDVSTTAGTFQITWDATGIFVFDIT